jgi:hypothetical protein
LTNVRVVAGREVDGEDVHDDRLSRLQGTVAALVRVRALRASGDDGAVGGAAAPEQLHVYLPPQPLARQRLASPLQRTVFADPGFLQYPDGVGAGGFDSFLGFLDVGDLLFRFGTPQTVEDLAVGREGYAAGPQLVSVHDAEVCRHNEGRVQGT